MSPNASASSLAQTLLRIVLGVFLLTAGIGHMTWARQTFIAQVPTWLPMSADFVVIASGVVEIFLGLSLIFLSSKKVLIGTLTALFFVLIFPGNVSQYVNGINAFGLDTDNARLIRLFFQPVLVIWALWSTSAWAVWKKDGFKALFQM